MFIHVVYNYGHVCACGPLDHKNGIANASRASNICAVSEEPSVLLCCQGHTCQSKNLSLANKTAFLTKKDLQRDNAKGKECSC